MAPLPSPAALLPCTQTGVLPSQPLSSTFPNSHGTAGDSTSRGAGCKPGETLAAAQFHLSSEACCVLQPSGRGCGLRSQPSLQLDTHFFTCSTASGSRRHVARSKATESSAVASVSTSGVYPTRIPLQGKHRFLGQCC